MDADLSQRLDDLVQQHGLDDDLAIELRSWLDTLSALSTLNPGSDTWSPDDDSTEQTVPIAHGAPPKRRYHLLELLGRGGMGEVWLARDDHLRRDVALKLVRPELTQPSVVTRFVAEARVTARLQHPGVVPVYDLATWEDGRLYYTMNVIRGVTLHEACRAPTWDPTRGVEVVRSVAETLAFAHDMGVLHRDIKPANIMLGEHGEVLVLDWGLVRTATEDALDGPGPALDLPTGLTRAGRASGTKGWMAPEQERGELALLGPTTDVWALGLLLTHVFGDAPMAPGLRELVEHAGQQDPAERPSSAEFAERVGTWLHAEREILSQFSLFGDP